MLFSTGNIASQSAVIEDLLLKRYRQVRKKEMGGNTFVCAEKWAFCYLGVYVVHLGVLVIIAGIMLGSLFGFSASVDIVEGEIVDTIRLDGDRGMKSLDFAIRLDRFYLDFYDNGMPKTYRSDLTFQKNGRVIYQGPLLVNHPICIEDILFYQASYGMAGDREALISIRKRKQEIFRNIRVGDSFELPGGRESVEIIRIEEDFMRMGPAVKVHARSANEEAQFWVFQYRENIETDNPGLLQMAPQFNSSLFKPYVFELKGLVDRHYSGLQVTHDPGLPVVAGGAILMMVGFMITFCFSHRRIWIRIDKAEGETRMSFAGMSSRHPRGLEREIRSILDDYEKRDDIRI